ncbi:hypothetical protein [Paenarthrobacter ureafaciens]|uniref:hypothetical protein n=1 Tax=Paenarthrobacter ureafaciens TaxID=37931 RepID=UPI001C2B96FB|nr:hypothetical protein [Paenarthrobacter ureafaciens]UOD80457.1 hypothetical protein MQZ73_15240 [Paenarthrobacter ureafaciens]WNZ03108.1 hypothetical protein PVT25_15870 [Paenarthrobacter ureafaciens]
MSSSLGFLAYVLREPETAAATATRVEHARQHLASRYRSGLSITQVNDTRSGLIGFDPDDTAVMWDRFSIRSGTGLAWLHVPSLAGSPEEGLGEWELANAVFSGQIKPSELGCPFAVARWHDGQLEIVNDVLGLVRLFHYEFDGGDVWSTRMGLAHVFMGEAPKKNLLAWGGMATIGWAPGGSTQLGRGQQVPGASRVRAGFSRSGRYIHSDRNVGEWLEDVRSAPEPSAATNVRDMEVLMSSAKRWPTPAVSDLSGGKDSRVISAMGIRSGSIAAVRTIASDHGEVDTAKTLMASISTAVEHLVIPKTARSTAGPSALDRLSTQHKAFEGRYLPTSGFNAGPFAGYRSGKQAKFNGLGGEVMNGGSFTPGPWREKLSTAPAKEASEVIVKMIARGFAASDQAKEAIGSFAQDYPEKISDVTGINTASGVLDLFYSMDRMPNWSNVFAGSDTLCPLFASSILSLGARNIGAPVPDGELHRKFLSAAIPAWSKIPFYKPVGRSKRALPMVWESPDWKDIEGFMLDNADRLDAFSPDGVRSLLGEIESGSGVKAHEAAVHRFLWNATFEGYEQEVATEATGTRAALLKTTN